jgi:predicted dehydrogenase
MELASRCPRVPFRIGIVGGAFDSAVGHTHFNASRLDGHFLLEAGCFSRNAARNEESARVYGVVPERVYPNWQQLLESETSNLDAIVVLTPTPTHAEIVVACLNAGYPVICEKSLGVSSDECRLISEVVAKQRGFLAVTFNYSGYPMVRELRRMISEGRIGTVQQIHVEMPQESFLRKQSAPQDWRKKDYFVPTVSLDLGVHVHHLVDFLTGGKKPVRLVANQSTYGKFRDIIDNEYCMAQYEGDTSVRAWWGKTALGYRNGLQVRVFGDKGSAQWVQMDPEELRWSDDDGHHFTLDRGSGEAETAGAKRYNRFKAGHPSGFIEAFANLYADIAESLWAHREGRKTASVFVYGAEQAEDGLKFLETVNRSSREGCWISMNN